MTKPVLWVKGHGRAGDKGNAERVRAFPDPMLVREQPREVAWALLVGVVLRGAAAEGVKVAAGKAVRKCDERTEHLIDSKRRCLRCQALTEVVPWERAL
jgi:hypothetical protein